MMFRSPFIAAMIVATVAGTAAGAQPGPPFTVKETGATYSRLADAVKAVGGNNATIVIAPGTYGDCAVQTAGRITYKAAVPGRTVFDGGICEEKATLVLRGKAATIDGIIFQNQRVPDGNGAGIRIERGDLYIYNAMFRNAEQGILSADDRGRLPAALPCWPRALRPRPVLRAQHLYRRFRFAEGHQQPVRKGQWRPLCQKPCAARNDHQQQF